jgi:hypothetical protein
VTSIVPNEKLHSVTQTHEKVLQFTRSIAGTKCGGITALCQHKKSYNHQPKPIAQKKENLQQKPRLRSKGNLQINKNVHGATLKKNSYSKNPLHNGLVVQLKTNANPQKFVIKTTHCPDIGVNH